MTETGTQMSGLSSPAGLDGESLARLSARIRRDVEDGRILGASILVGRGGQICYRDIIGESGPNRAMAADDLFLMMSLSKSFTAALTLRAVDHGRFDLDTRVCEFLPQFAAGGKQRVTIRQLLTHTAGTYAGIQPPPPITASDYGDLAAYVDAVSAIPATHIPGSRVVYNSAASYAVLGQILVVTDPDRRGFAEIAHEDLFAPLGMSDTSYGLSAAEPRRVPAAFTPANSTPVTPLMETMLNGWGAGLEIPAGNAYSTVDDVFRLAETMRRRGQAASGHRLLSPALLDYASQVHTGDMGNGAWDFYREAFDIAAFPANFTLMGGYGRGVGHYLTACGQTASARAFCAVGGGSTFWLVDPQRDLTFVFLSAGFIEGLAHFRRLEQLADLALAAATD